MKKAILAAVLILSFSIPVFAADVGVTAGAPVSVKDYLLCTDPFDPSANPTKWCVFPEGAAQDHLANCELGTSSARVANNFTINCLLDAGEDHILEMDPNRLESLNTFKLNNLIIDNLVVRNYNDYNILTRADGGTGGKGEDGSNDGGDGGAGGSGGSMGDRGQDGSVHDSSCNAKDGDGATNTGLYSGGRLILMSNTLHWTGPIIADGVNGVDGDNGGVGGCGTGDAGTGGGGGSGGNAGGLVSISTIVGHVMDSASFSAIGGDGGSGGSGGDDEDYSGDEDAGGAGGGGGADGGSLAFSAYRCDNCILTGKYNLEGGSGGSRGGAGGRNCVSGDYYSDACPGTAGKDGIAGNLQTISLRDNRASQTGATAMEDQIRSYLASKICLSPDALTNSFAFTESPNLYISQEAEVGDGSFEGGLGNITSNSFISEESTTNEAFAYEPMFTTLPSQVNIFDNSQIAAAAVFGFLGNDAFIACTNDLTQDCTLFEDDEGRVLMGIGPVSPRLDLINYNTQLLGGAEPFSSWDRMDIFESNCPNGIDSCQAIYLTGFLQPYTPFSTIYSKYNSGEFFHTFKKDGLPIAGLDGDGNLYISSCAVTYEDYSDITRTRLNQVNFVIGEGGELMIQIKRTGAMTSPDSYGWNIALSAAGGCAGGAAVGAGLGLAGGPFAPLTSTAGAIGGCVIGGVMSASTQA